MSETDFRFSRHVVNRSSHMIVDPGCTLVEESPFTYSGRMDHLLSNDHLNLQFVLEFLLENLLVVRVLQ